MKRLFGLTILASLLSCGAAWAQVSDGVVKLGVLNDMSSSTRTPPAKAAFWPPRWRSRTLAVRFWARRLRSSPATISNKTDIGAGIARQWIDTDHVDVIVDVPTSSVALAIQEVTREKKRLFLMSGPASSDLTGKACSPYGFQWTYDTYALAHGTGGALVKQGGNSWFFYHGRLCLWPCLERDTGNAVKAAGGTVLVLFALRSIPRTSRRTCCRPSPRRRRLSASPMPAATPLMRLSKPRNSE